MIVFQTPTTVAGTVLIIEDIESQNYVPGSTGWAIFANGDAEFGQLTARGTFISGSGTGKHIVIDGTTGSIEFFTGDAQEAAPGSIIGNTDGAAFPTLDLRLSSPEGGAPTQVAQIFLTSQTNNANGSFISLLAEQVGMADAITLDTNETWHNITLLNGWATLNALTPGYRKNVDGECRVRGRVASGAGIIGTLPVGYRPTTTFDIGLKSNNDASSYSWLQVGTNGNITVVGNVPAAQVWLTLNFSFSTL